MGFSGGSSNVTKAHTHSSAIVQDGGALNFSNVTQAGMAAGDITYSNGTALQVLGLGSATDTLTVNAGATAPEWAAGGGGGGGNYVHVEQFTATASSTFTCTLSSPLAVGDFVKIVGIWRGKWNASGGNAALEMQVVSNNETMNSGYSWASNVLTSSSTFTDALDAFFFTIGNDTTSVASRGRIDFALTCLAVPTAQNNEVYVTWWQTGTNVQPCATGGGFTYDHSGSTMTSIDGFIFENDAGQDIESGTTLDLYKVTS
jgi:hypothetical protein